MQQFIHTNKFSQGESSCQGPVTMPPKYTKCCVDHIYLTPTPKKDLGQNAPGGVIFCHIFTSVFFKDSKTMPGPHPSSLCVNFAFGLPSINNLCLRETPKHNQLITNTVYCHIVKHKKDSTARTHHQLRVLRVRCRPSPVRRRVGRRRDGILPATVATDFVEIACTGSR